MADKIAIAIVTAAAVVAAAILFRPSEPVPRYSIGIAESGFVRLDTLTGETVACGGGGCVVRIDGGDQT